MSFCYRFKLRLPHPNPRKGSKTVHIKVPVPFKSRRCAGGRFAYAGLENDGNKLFVKALKLFRRRKEYETL